MNCFLLQSNLSSRRFSIIHGVCEMKIVSEDMRKLLNRRSMRPGATSPRPRYPLALRRTAAARHRPTMRTSDTVQALRPPPLPSAWCTCRRAPRCSFWRDDRKSSAPRRRSPLRPSTETQLETGTEMEMLTLFRGFLYDL